MSEYAKWDQQALLRLPADQRHNILLLASEIDRLREDVACYEAMKEGVAQRVAELEQQLAAVNSERDEQHTRILQLILERDKYRCLAEQRWAMRKEFEELVGLNNGDTYDETKFVAAVAKVKAWKQAAESKAAKMTERSDA